MSEPETYPPDLCSEPNGHAAGGGGACELVDTQAQYGTVAHDGVSDLAGFRALRAWAEMFDDMMRARVAIHNRMVGSGLDPETYEPSFDAVRRAEMVLRLAMRKTYRQVAPESIREWQQETVGIGEHLLARLLGAVGHPVWAARFVEEEDEIVVVVVQRRVGDLWAYCGHGDAGRKRRRGMSAEDSRACGNPQAKTITRLLAEACMKNRRSPYRAVYDARREWSAVNRPEWTAGHSHSDALRLVGKEILRDLWLVGKEDG